MNEYEAKDIERIRQAKLLHIDKMDSTQLRFAQELLNGGDWACASWMLWEDNQVRKKWRLKQYDMVVDGNGYLWAAYRLLGAFETVSSDKNPEVQAWSRAWLEYVSEDDVTTIEFLEDEIDCPCRSEDCLVPLHGVRAKVYVRRHYNKAPPRPLLRCMWGSAHGPDAEFAGPADEQTREEFCSTFEVAKWGYKAEPEPMWRKDDMHIPRRMWKEIDAAKRRFELDVEEAGRGARRTAGLAESARQNAMEERMRTRLRGAVSQTMAGAAEVLAGAVQQLAKG